MVQTVLLIALMLGPLIGYLCGLWATYVHEHDHRKASLQAGITSWFISGLAALIVSYMTIAFFFRTEFAISVLGVQVYGITIGAWFASLIGAVTSLVSTSVHK